MVMCNESITDTADDAHQCEGSCQKWLHRYCAGVSISHFQEHASGYKPFVFLYSLKDTNRAVVNNNLKAEVAELKKKIAHLKSALATAVRFRLNVHGEAVAPPHEGVTEDTTMTGKDRGETVLPIQSYSRVTKTGTHVPHEVDSKKKLYVVNECHSGITVPKFKFLVLAILHARKVEDTSNLISVAYV